MVGNRVCYLAVLCFLLVFSMLYGAWFSWYTLIVTLLLLPLDLIISLPGMLFRQGALAVPPVLEQGEQGMVRFSVPARRRFPTGGIKGRIAVTRKGKTVRRRIFFSGDKWVWELPPADTAHSGLVCVALRRLWCTSLLGFFALPVPIRVCAVALVLPKPQPPQHPPVPPTPPPLRPKPGGGYAEEHDIRPYRPGDPISSMHWKLSAKYDSPMIREPLERPARDRLIQCGEWSSVREQDLALGRLRWLSALLLKRECPHYARIGVSGAAAYIGCGEDLTAFYRRILGGEPGRNPALPTHFTSVYRIDGALSAERKEGPR